MKVLIFVLCMIFYITSCIFIAKANVLVRRKVLGNLAAEYVLWIVFIVIYIPYSFFFPAWLSEVLEIWRRTENTTILMLSIGMVVSILGLYKGGKVNAT